MDFLSRRYLCVKFLLHLMHTIHSLIHVEKSILKGHFQPIKGNENWFRKKMLTLLFCSITWDNGYLQWSYKISKNCHLVQLHNWVNSRRVERYKVNLISRNQDPMHASLALSSLLSVWYQPNSLNNKSIYNTLLLEFYICAKPRLTHWISMSQKKRHYFCTGVYVSVCLKVIGIICCPLQQHVCGLPLTNRD